MRKQNPDSAVTGVTGDKAAGRLGGEPRPGPGPRARAASPAENAHTGHMRGISGQRGSTLTRKRKQLSGASEPSAHGLQIRQTNSRAGFLRAQAGTRASVSRQGQRTPGTKGDGFCSWSELVSRPLQSHGDGVPCSFPGQREELMKMPHCPQSLSLGGWRG